MIEKHYSFIAYYTCIKLGGKGVKTNAKATFKMATLGQAAQ